MGALALSNVFCTASASDRQASLVVLEVVVGRVMYYVFTITSRGTGTHCSPLAAPFYYPRPLGFSDVTAIQFRWHWPRGASTLCQPVCSETLFFFDFIRFCLEHPFQWAGPLQIIHPFLPWHSSGRTIVAFTPMCDDKSMQRVFQIFRHSRI